MKNFRLGAMSLLLLCLVAVSGLFASCSMEKARLQAEIEIANKECPVSLGEEGRMTAIKFDEDKNQAQFYFDMNEDVIDIDQLKAAGAETRDMILIVLTEGDTRELIEEIVAAKAGLAIFYKGASSGKTFTVEFTPEELKNIVNEDLSAEQQAERKLAAWLAQNQKQMPEQIEEGLTLVKVEDNGKYIVNEVEVDENLYSMADIEVAAMKSARALRLNLPARTLRSFIRSSKLVAGVSPMTTVATSRARWSASSSRPPRFKKIRIRVGF